jgi:O-antigen/teichoic acid export membrane protein
MPEPISRAPHDVEGEGVGGKTHDIAVAVRNSFKLGSSLLVTWGVAMFVKLRVPVHLGPIRQGHFGFAESFAAMFFTALHLGVDTYVMKEVSIRPKHASDFIGGIFVLRVIMSAVLLGVMAVALWVTGRSEIQLVVAVFGLCQLAMSINGTLATVLQATTKVGRLAVANVLAKLVWGTGLLFGLRYDVPLYVLAMPVLISELLRTAVLFGAAREATHLDYRVDVSAVRKVIVTALPFFVSSVAIGLGQNMAMSGLEFLRRDDREVGWFNADMNLATLAMLLSPLLMWVVMPALSRAHARSPEEMLRIMRRVVDGLVIVIAPVTVLISVSADLTIKLVFHDKYAPAATGLSILSMVFSVTYINMMLSMALTVLGRSWSVTMISLGAIATMALFMVGSVPLGRFLFHEGGECAGAAMAVIGSEACVVLALLSRFRPFPLDRRNIEVCGKAIAIALAVIFTDRLLRIIGDIRLVADAALYAGLALRTGVLRIEEIRRGIRILRGQGTEGDAPPSSSSPSIRAGTV